MGKATMKYVVKLRKTIIKEYEMLVFTPAEININAVDAMKIAEDMLSQSVALGLESIVLDLNNKSVSVKETKWSVASVTTKESEKDNE
jgi:hypothetical protein